MNLKISIRGDKIVVTKAIKDYLHEKLERLNKYFKNSEDIKCNVIIRVKNNLQTVEVSIPTSKFNIRCEEGSDNLYASIDMIIDKLERMIRKNKTRLNNHYKNIPSFEMNLKYEETLNKVFILTIEDNVDGEMFYEETLNEEPDKIVKRKTLDTKPMDEDEAIMQMELLNHDFFTFKNINEECVSVLYKRKDGSLGIINVK